MLSAADEAQAKAQAMSNAVDRQQSIGAGCIMKGIGVSFWATGREVGIVVGTANHERRGADTAEIDIEKRKAFGVFGGCALRLLAVALRQLCVASTGRDNNLLH